MPKIESKRPRREDRRDRDRGDRGNFSSRDEGRSDRRSFRDDHLQSYRIEVVNFMVLRKVILWEPLLMR